MVDASIITTSRLNIYMYKYTYKPANTQQPRENEKKNNVI